jgi:hypothetical protein
MMEYWNIEFGKLGDLGIGEIGGLHNCMIA